MNLEPGVHVTPNVKLVRPLGEGGMGAVWVAEHLALGTEVAVKFLQGDYAKDPAARARFSQEAAAASQVKSSHVVKIYDYGITDADVPFIVMEMLEGTDLAGRIAAERKLAPAEVVTVVAQLCKALQRAHEGNVIHRDVKPENVFLTQEGGDTFVKLLDFGIAKSSAVKALSASSRRSTLAGESLGTPYYMSPEQFKSAKSIDLRSDLWSVGVLTYEALTGELPFVADTVGALAIVVNEADATPPSKLDPSLPPAFDAWFAKACARDPNDRFASARDLADALRAAFGTAPLSLDSGSHRRVVISQIPADELENSEKISLRETSFATSAGGREAPKSRARVLLPVALAGVAALAIGLFALTRGPSTPVTSTASAGHASAAAPPSSAPRATAPEPIVTAPLSAATSVATIASPAPAATHHATHHVVTPATSGSGAHHERDIW